LHGCSQNFSLSDDSLGNSNKKSSILETLGQPRKKTKKKDSVPWWISEEDLDDGVVSDFKHSSILSVLS
uniref:Centrosomal protein 162 n=1 Tax=Strix occidentalis caurina TaxID=311401 RepID=A0A8D0FN42_STROC